MGTSAGANLSQVTIETAGDSDGVDWDAYLVSHPRRTFAHRWGWRSVLQNSFGIAPAYFVARADNRIVGLLPAALMKSRLFGRFVISLPWLDYGGPLADSDEIAQALVNRAGELASDNRCQFVEMRAVRQPLPNLTEKTDKQEFVLDLSEGEEAVWKSFDAKARNQVRKGQKADLNIAFHGEDKLTDFYTVFARNMRDLGTPVWPRSLFTEIFRAFPGEAEIAVVDLDGKTIAAGLLLHYQDFSAMPSASSYREYRSLCPNNVLYWGVIRHCLERGSTRFDFGRSSKDAGTYRFKKQWVRKPVGQVWQYKLLTIDSLPELNPSNPKFKLAIATWRRLPLFLANAIGPRIVTKIP